VRMCTSNLKDLYTISGNTFCRGDPTLSKDDSDQLGGHVAGMRERATDFCTKVLGQRNLAKPDQRPKGRDSLQIAKERAP